MQSTRTLLSSFDLPPSSLMLLCSFARALLILFFLISEADASANATASPTPSGTFSSTANQPGTLFSDPPNARHEERAPGVENIGFATLLAKSKQAVMAPIDHTTLGLKLGWWRVFSVHPFTVYTNLKLDQVKGNILMDSRFRNWVRYVDSFNPNRPGKKVSVLAKLNGQFSPYELNTMLGQAERAKKPSIRALGTRLQKEQTEAWKKDAVSPMELHNLLQSDPSHPILLTGRAYNIWSAYLSEYNPGRSMTPLQQLLHSFDHSSLSSLLIASKLSKKKETATLATNLQLELEKFWLSKDEAPERVFKYLLLDRTPNDNLELESWIRYAKMYQKKTGKDVTLAQVLASHFETDIIKNIIRTANTKDEKELAENLKKKLAEKLVGKKLAAPAA